MYITIHGIIVDSWQRHIVALHSSHTANSYYTHTHTQSLYFGLLYYFDHRIFTTQWAHSPSPLHSLPLNLRNMILQPIFKWKSYIYEEFWVVVLAGDAIAAAATLTIVVFLYLHRSFFVLFRSGMAYQNYFHGKFVGLGKQSGAQNGSEFIHCVCVCSWMAIKILGYDIGRRSQVSLYIRERRKLHTPFAMCVPVHNPTNEWVKETDQKEVENERDRESERETTKTYKKWTKYKTVRKIIPYNDGMAHF